MQYKYISRHGGNDGRKDRKMGTWKEHINDLKTEWIGKKVIFEGNIHTIVDVDYNGILHIDRPTEHNKTTAAFVSYEAKNALI